MRERVPEASHLAIRGLVVSRRFRLVAGSSKIRSSLRDAGFVDVL
jgi:hypothetical protein